MSNDGIQSFILKSAENLRIAAAVHEAWPEVRHRIGSGFLSRLERHLAAALPGWKPLVWERYFIDQWACFYWFKPGWTSQYYVALQASQFGEVMELGIQRDQDEISSRPHDERVLDIVRRLHPSARQAAWWEAKVLLRSPASDWRSPEILWRMQHEQAFLNTVATQMIDLSKAVESTVDSMADAGLRTDRKSKASKSSVGGRAVSGESLKLPRLICAADWSKSADRRRAAVAVRVDDRYRIDRIDVVADPSKLLDSLRAKSGDGGVFLGFDFPIGLPVAYAARRGFKTWREAMEVVSRQKTDFFVETDEPSIEQPFYPKSSRPAGQFTLARLVQSLELKTVEALFRGCECQNHEGQQPACLFFTIGPQQVGRAALNGWKSVILPNIGSLALWPHDGDLADLLDGKKPVIAEIYPAEFYRFIGPPAGAAKWSKAKREDRRKVAPNLLKHAGNLGLGMSSEVQNSVESGFETDDEFDAFVGLIGMLAVLRGKIRAMPEEVPDGIEIEGWILGRPGPTG